jgi:hypothetical protein
MGCSGQANYSSRLALAGPVGESLIDSFRATLAASTATAYATVAANAPAASDLALAKPLANAATEAKATLAAIEEESDVTPDGSPYRLDGRAGGWQRSLSEVGLRSWPAADSKARIART